MSQPIGHTAGSSIAIAAANIHGVSRQYIIHCTRGDGNGPRSSLCVYARYRVCREVVSPRLAADVIARHACANDVEANGARARNPKKIRACTNERPTVIVVDEFNDSDPSSRLRTIPRTESVE